MCLCTLRHFVDELSVHADASDGSPLRVPAPSPNAIKDFCRAPSSTSPIGRAARLIKRSTRRRRAPSSRIYRRMTSPTGGRLRHQTYGPGPRRTVSSNRGTAQALPGMRLQRACVHIGDRSSSKRRSRLRAASADGDASRSRRPRCRCRRRATPGRASARLQPPLVGAERPRPADGARARGRGSGAAAARGRGGEKIEAARLKGDLKAIDRISEALALKNRKEPRSSHALIRSSGPGASEPGVAAEVEAAALEDEQKLRAEAAEERKLREAQAIEEIHDKWVADDRIGRGEHCRRSGEGESGVADGVGAAEADAAAIWQGTARRSRRSRWRIQRQNERRTGG